MSLKEKILEASTYIINQIKEPVEIGIILGSGLGAIADRIDEKILIPYDNIPCFPISTVKGHLGRLITGTLNGKKILAMQGRFHYYEGYSMEEVTFPIRVMKQLGVKVIIVTNAAGGLNRDYKVGDLVLITDHINLMGNNPLIGQNLQEFGVRFPDMQEAYSRELISLSEKIGKSNNILLKKGVYAAVTGPNYETPAEIKMLSVLGADCVGMSTVPEVIVARHQQMKVLGISSITNMSINKEHQVNHNQVIQTAEKTALLVEKLLTGIIGEIQMNI